jgi:hypothetical protein
MGFSSWLMIEILTGIFFAFDCLCNMSLLLMYRSTVSKILLSSDTRNQPGKESTSSSHDVNKLVQQSLSDMRSSTFSTDINY